MLDLAVSLGVGGDCLAVAALREAPAVFGPVASDPTVSRLVDVLARDADKALAAIDTARATARKQVWARAGTHAPDHDVDHRRPLLVDVDATLVTAHSDKEHAAATFKHGWGHHPLTAFVDHGPDGTGEPLTMMLRRGNAGSNTTADHTRCSSVSTEPDRPTSCSTGSRPGPVLLGRVRVTREHRHLLTKIPTHAWSPALDADGALRDGAWVAELTGLLNLTRWPAGMRVIARVERPHPGAQLRITRPQRQPRHRGL